MKKALPPDPEDDVLKTTEARIALNEIRARDVEGQARLVEAQIRLANLRLEWAGMQDRLKAQATEKSHA
jgi:hypothetical protein